MIDRWGELVGRRALAVLLLGVLLTLGAGAFGAGVFDSLSQVTGFGRAGSARPKGARLASPSLIDWRPKGMPTMVRQRMIPPMMYPRAVTNPPKINQMMLPNKDISMPSLIFRTCVLLSLAWAGSRPELPWPDTNLKTYT